MIVIEPDDTGKYIFYCPGCKCCHYIQFAPKVPAWTWNNDVEKPTIQPSILVRSGARKGPTVCHMFVKDGFIEFLSDCTHELAGKTVPMEAI